MEENSSFSEKFPVINVLLNTTGGTGDCSGSCLHSINFLAGFHEINSQPSWSPTNQQKRQAFNQASLQWSTSI